MEKQKYDTVNGVWPEGPLPKLTGHEAIRAAKRLYRLVMKKSWNGKWKAGRGNHRSYPRHGYFLVNPGQGWHDMVHDLSHACHRKLYPDHKPHDGRGTHAFIERQMVEHVVASGWLDGRLKAAEKPKPNLRNVRGDRIKARIAAWEAKERRARNALKKLRRSAAYYKRKAA